MKNNKKWKMQVKNKELNKIYLNKKSKWKVCSQTHNNLIIISHSINNNSK